MIDQGWTGFLFVERGYSIPIEYYDYIKCHSNSGKSHLAQEIVEMTFVSARFSDIRKETTLFS